MLEGVGRIEVARGGTGVDRGLWEAVEKSAMQVCNAEHYELVE